MVELDFDGWLVIYIYIGDASGLYGEECEDLKKAYHHLIPQRNSTWLFLDIKKRPFESMVDPLEVTYLRDVPHIAGRAVFPKQFQRKLHELQEKQQEGEAGDGGMARLPPSGSLFYHMGKEVKKYLLENGSGTSLCICRDIHSRISHMTALFLNTALREAGG